VKRIVWATDGAPAMGEEHSLAKGLAKMAGAKLVVAHVREVYASRGGVFLDSSGELEGTLEETVKGLKSEGVHAELRLLKTNAGNAAHAIDQLARDVAADVVIVGSRGHGPIAAMLLGSVTFSLLQMATYPVLVVPSRQAGT
jgi:nucleotide-binding universal stress UspA family protein